MPRIFRANPFLRVPDIGEAVAFFTDTLGFTCEFQTHDYASVQRDGVYFQMSGDGADIPPKGGGRYTVYVEVDDADALYAELKPKLDLLPPGQVCPPCDMHYGQRDFWVVGPDGDIIAFGSPLAR
jgi:catechol 2,3-dioxygenase-like lactoylglutathione lyase family enzyme